MMKYQDMTTGHEWHFDEGVDIDAQQNVPKTLTENIIPRPDELHDWTGNGWKLNQARKDGESNARILADIAAIEQKQIRPARELLLDPANAYAKNKLENFEFQIVALRSKLVK